MSYAFLRWLLLSRLPPETAHDLAIKRLAWVSRKRLLTKLLRKRHRDRLSPLPRTVMGIEFPNPVGLAAGVDKQCQACNALHALGFGWVELGTVTPLLQHGNQEPRLFWLPEHHAAINRMGFNSVGLDRFVKNLESTSPDIIKGINIGKNTTTLDALADYLVCLEAVHDHADYVAINISSPNTRGLRDLQREDALGPLLAGLDSKRMELAEKSGRRLPLVLKISPDLDAAALDHIVAMARRHHMDGIAATNTTLSRDGVRNHLHAGEAGGLSGPPLAARATEAIAYLHRNLQGEIPLIGIGGIDSVAAAVEKFQAGAELVQICTGFTHHGPKLIGDIIDGLRDGINGS